MSFGRCRQLRCQIAETLLSISRRVVGAGGFDRAFRFTQRTRDLLARIDDFGATTIDLSESGDRFVDINAIHLFSKRFKVQAIADRG